MCGTWNRSVRISTTVSGGRLRCCTAAVVCRTAGDVFSIVALRSSNVLVSELRRRGFVRCGVSTAYDFAQVRLGRNGREGLRPQAPCKMHCAIHGVWCDAGMLKRQRNGRRGRARGRQGLQSWDVLETCLFAAQADISGSCARHFCG